MSATTAEPAAPPANPLILFGRPALRLLLLIVLFAALLPPQCMIAELIEEREARQEEVRAEIATAWGRPQSVLPPVLAVPTLIRGEPVPVIGPTGLPVLPALPPPPTPAVLAIPPGSVEARVRLEPETRQRGIFAAVVYRARVELTGQISVPAEIPAGEHDWREAAIVLAATDLRATSAEPALESGERRLTAAGATGWEACRGMETLRWPLRLGAPLTPGTTVPFSVAIDLRGTSSFRLLAAARRTAFEASAPWDTPSFAGSDLPARSEVGDHGFSAEWLTGNRQAGARVSTDWCEAVGRTAGVQEINLLEAVPTYRMVNRAAKYAVLIVALALLTYTLFELLARVAIHPVQYALVGLSVVLFPLLLLALGEPLGFSAAFAIAAAMVTAQSGAYTWMTTRRAGLAALFAGVLAGMFAFVHTVLRLESYALLAGAVALFAGLSVLMVVTRRVRWGA